jgi:hypothetical protein
MAGTTASAASVRTAGSVCGTLASACYIVRGRYVCSVLRDTTVSSAHAQRVRSIPQGADLCVCCAGIGEAAELRLGDVASPEGRDAKYNDEPCPLQLEPLRHRRGGDRCGRVSPACVVAREHADSSACLGMSWLSWRGRRCRLTHTPNAQSKAVDADPLCWIEFTQDAIMTSCKSGRFCPRVSPVSSVIVLIARSSCRTCENVEPPVGFLAAISSGGRSHREQLVDERGGKEKYTRVFSFALAPISCSSSIVTVFLFGGWCLVLCVIPSRWSGCDPLQRHQQSPCVLHPKAPLSVFILSMVTSKRVGGTSSDIEKGF